MNNLPFNTQAPATPISTEELDRSKTVKFELIDDLLPSPLYRSLLAETGRKWVSIHKCGIISSNIEQEVKKVKTGVRRSNRPGHL